MPDNVAPAPPACGALGAIDSATADPVVAARDARPAPPRRRPRPVPRPAAGNAALTPAMPDNVAPAPPACGALGALGGRPRPAAGNVAPAGNAEAVGNADAAPPRPV
jgi:hypothetical protein